MRGGTEDSGIRLSDDFHWLVGQRSPNDERVGVAGKDGSVRHPERLEGGNLYKDTHLPRDRCETCLPKVVRSPESNLQWRASREGLM